MSAHAKNHMAVLSKPPHRAVADESAFPRAALTAGYVLPSHDVGELLGRLDTQLFPHERRAVQYLHWAVTVGLFELMAEVGEVTIEVVNARTALNASGADALLGVLCAVGLAVRDRSARYRLTDLAREYFLKDSPFFIGDGLDSREPEPHPLYVQGGATRFRYRARHLILKMLPSIRYGSFERICNQHTRNLTACAAAVRTNEFGGLRCLVDLAGGSGTFSIPFALEYPETRVILVELPQALKNVRPLLVRHRLEERVELLGMDAFQYPWRIPACDGIFTGNFLHGFDDAACRRICRESYERLISGGRIWVHELIWNEHKDGPLITAMWNAAMRSGGPGRQRTGRELLEMLQGAGFQDLRTVPTAGGFALLAGRKP